MTAPPGRGALGRWEVIEDVALADCALQIDGADLGDLFATGAAALAEVMVDPATLTRTRERTVTIEAGHLDLLFFDWLSELIYLKDRDGEVFPEAEARVEGDGPCRLTARLTGGPIDAGRTALRADPKAVTFHQFSVARADGGWRASVVIDI